VLRLKHGIVYREELGTTVVSTDLWPLLVDRVGLVAEIHNDVDVHTSRGMEYTLPEDDSVTVSDQ